MKNWLVFWEDDSWENGGIGLKVFNHKEDALNFIEKRLKAPDQWKQRNLDMYTLIRGSIIELTVIHQIIKVGIK